MATKASGKDQGTPRPVSQARLSQKCGPRNSYGGYTKVNNGDGSFTMKKTGE